MSGRRVLDLFLIYQFLRRLVSPFDKWEAYKQGVIDRRGNVIVPKDERTEQQRRAWGYYDRLLANLKKLLEKIPGGRTRIASFAAALLLLKESNADPDNTAYLEERLKHYMNEAFLLIEDGAIANNAGDGNIAGIGVGDDGEPPIDNKKKKKKKKRVLKRNGR